MLKETEFSVLICDNESNLELINRDTLIAKIVTKGVAAIHFHSSAAKGESDNAACEETVILHVIAPESDVRINHKGLVSSEYPVSVQKIVNHSEIASPIASAPIIVIFPERIISVCVCVKGWK